MSLRENYLGRTGVSRLALLCAAAVGFASLLFDTPASAAALTKVPSGWQQGTEPTWVSMYEYVPDTVPPGAPILVIVHFCAGRASNIFSQATQGGIVTLADQKGILLVVPETAQNCWDVATTASLTHDGGGDTGAIVHQVKYAVTAHGGNPDRVYVMGTSSGGMVTQALLAVYPEVFKGGAEFAGVPAGCWSVNDPDGQWSGPCAGGQVTNTAEVWGNMVRMMDPGYTSSFRPRIQLWHGDADTTISPVNQTEAIKQWTNVMGFTTTATMTTTETVNGHSFKREQWVDSCGSPVIDAWTESGGPHGTSLDMNGTFTMPFFGLDTDVGPVDPQVAKCAMAAGGAGGMPATGGMSGTGGTAPATEPDPYKYPGCSCEVPGTSRVGSAWTGLIAIGAGMLFGRRRRVRRTTDTEQQSLKS
jgi:poly(hydroxyalkanoate) depolymerase family esterase